jgi:hypothetical protein
MDLVRPATDQFIWIVYRERYVKGGIHHSIGVFDIDRYEGAKKMKRVLLLTWL